MLDSRPSGPTPESSRSGDSAAFAGTFLANGGILAIGMATGILAARLLGPEGRGSLAAVILWPQLIAGLGLLGLDEGLTYAVGRRRLAWRRIGADGVAGALVLAIPVAGVSVLGLPWLLGESRSGLWSFARLYAVIYVPLHFLTLAALALLRGTERFRAYNALRVLRPLLYLLPLLLMWAWGGGSVTRVAAADLAAIAVVAGFSLFLVRPVLGRRPDRATAVETLRTGLRFHWASVLMIASLHADRLLAVRLFDDATVGHYMVAFSLASVGFGAVGGTFHTVLAPRLAGTRRPRGLQMLARGLREATLLLAVVALLVAGAAPWLVELFFGPAFAPAAPIARLLVLASLVAAFKEVVIRSIRGLGDGRAGTVAEALCLGSFLALAWPAATALGPRGLALALLAGNAIGSAYLVRHLGHRYGFSSADLWGLRPRTVAELWQGVRATVQGMP